MTETGRPGETVPMRRGLPLMVLVALAAVYAAVAIGLCLVPVGEGIANRAGGVLGNDFLVFFSAADLVRSGAAAADIFDAARLQAHQDALSGLGVHLPWAYPPHLLLLVRWMAALPYAAALGLWLAATTLPFAVLARRASGAAWVLILLAPPVVQNAADGQNGALTATLILAGVTALAAGRSLLAGVAFGLLVYKPQVAVLAPIALVAARDRRALVGFALGAAALPALSLVVDGWAPWRAFLAHLPDHFALVVDGRLPRERFPTVFAAVLGASGSAPVARVAQAVATIVAWAGVYWAWRRTDDPWLRLAALCVAMPLATPFLLEYDLVIWAVPGLMLARSVWRGEASAADAGAMVLFLFTPPVIWMAGLAGWTLGAVPVVVLAAWTVRRIGSASAVGRAV